MQAALALSVLLILSETAEADLLVNGSFEEDGGAFSGGQPILFSGSTVITGWIVTRENIDYVISGNGSFVAAEGQRSIDLDGTPGFGGIAQSFLTVPSQDYLVTLRLLAIPSAP